ncbi:MAG TPA: formylmethanofuran dehydrogenase [Gammaproteobacteria bacterium]|nr:formylmethanofuran dehydrogenase [Gammaproteobacteria bacterium]
MPESAADPSVPPSTTYDAVTCPFCALLCDDLVVTSSAGRLSAGDNACPKARASFARPVPAATPLVDGKPTSYALAVAAAVKRLKKSRQPLIAGLGTDVDGVRAALLLAERCGAILDHRHGRALLNNLRVLQSRGQATTTLGEVRNRADLVVLVGASIDEDFHGFARRCLRPADALLPERLARRQILHLGPAAKLPRQPGVDAQSLPCRDEELLEILNAVRALRAGRSTRLKARRLQLVTTLVERIAAAEYAVFVWAPGQLGVDGDLVIGALCDLIADLNRTQRAAGLALGGNDGGQSALATAAWHTGYPLQLSYAGATIEYDPLRFDTARLLADGAVDLLLWISSFNPVLAPASDAPLVVLGLPGTPLRATGEDGNAIFLPVGTPGLDHAGRLMRTDGVVALPLAQLRALGLPSAAKVLADLAEGMV